MDINSRDRIVMRSALDRYIADKLDLVRKRHELGKWIAREAIDAAKYAKRLRDRVKVDQ